MAALPPLATVDDLQTRLDRTLTAGQSDRAAAVLADVSAEIRTETGRPWTAPDGELDPARPDVLAVVALRAAERAMRNPAGLASETVGDYRRAFPDTDTPAAGVYLTDAERRMVRAAAGTADLASVPTVRDVEVSDRRWPADTVWLADQHGGDLIGWQRRP